MYVDITDRELEPCVDFYDGKAVYHKNGNGNWYHLIITDSSVWHTIPTVDGPKRISGKRCRPFDIPDQDGGIYNENELFVLNKDRLQLPLIPLEILFGGEKINIKDLSEKEIRSIGRRWTEYILKEKSINEL